MKVLIIRRDNIGDLVCTTPLFEALRHEYPQAYIACLVNSYNEPAIRDNPSLDDIFSYTKGKHATGEPVWRAHLRRFSLLRQLRRQRFDYVILASNNVAPRALRLARLIAPKHIVGFVANIGRPGRISCPVPLVPSSELHETEVLFRLLEPLGISAKIPALCVVPDADKVEQARKRLSSSAAASALLRVALQISSRKEKQRWPIERYAEFARRLHARCPTTFFLFWSPGDENNPLHPGDDCKAERLLKLVGDLPVTPMRTEHLSELIAGLSLCDIGVMSDGGAMHIAAGVGKPLVCLFGNSSAQNWHPWGIPYELLQTSSRDVNDITVDDVLDAFERLLCRLDFKPGPTLPGSPAGQ